MSLELVEPVNNNVRPTKGFDQPVAAIRKTNSIAYLDAIFDLQQRGFIVVPFEGTLSTSFSFLKVVETIVPDSGGGWFTRKLGVPRTEGAMAQISMTSGSTGEPKGILLSHRAMANTSDRLIAVMHMDASIQEYVGVPVTHSFGFGRVRAVCSLGGAAFIPDRGFRVDEFAAMLGRGEVNALSIVPTLARVILSQKSRFATIGTKLRWIELGSQFMTAEEKLALRELFPNAKIVQHYGLTEASRTTFLVVSDAKEADLQSVGQARDAVQLRITSEGRIAIKGPHVAEGMITPAGVVPLVDAEGWLVTNDLGHLNENSLYFDGRADDIINVGGIKIPAELFERRLTDLLSDGPVIAVAPGEDAMRGQVVVVAYEGDMTAGVPSKLASSVSDLARSMQVNDGAVLLALDRIPRTENGKIQRFKISDAYKATQLLTAVEDKGESIPIGDPIVDAFVKIFGASANDTTCSFQSLGGNSLNYVALLIELEKHLPAVPKAWDTLSIATLRELVSADAQPTAVSRIAHIPHNLDTVRTIACVLVVSLHVVGADPGDGLKIPDGSVWHRVMTALDLIRMPLFTAMAGFLYSVMPASREGFVGFMKRKLDQFLWPLLFVTLFYWGIRGVTYGSFDNLLDAYIYGYRHLWYIDTLLLMFAATALIDILTKPSVQTWGVVGAIVIAGSYVLPKTQVLHFSLGLTLYPFFVLGVLLHRAPAILSNRVLPWVSAIAIVAIMIIKQFLPEIAQLFPQYSLLWICGAASVIFFLRLFPRIHAIEWIAAYTFTIYLWHPAANAMVRNLLWKLGIHSYPVLFCIGLAVGVGIPILLHRIVMKMPRILSAPIIAR